MVAILLKKIFIKNIVSNINKELRSIFIHIPKCAGSSMEAHKWNIGSGHQTISDYKNNSINFDKFFKWCFVRNPWERIVSAYEDCPEIFKFAPSFDSFVNTLYLKKNNFPKGQIKYYDRFDIGFPIYRIHFMPMNLLIKIDNQICIDFIGRFENLQEDWEIVQKKLNIIPEKLKISNSRKQKVNLGRRTSDYKDLYNQNLIDLVGEIYEEDIKLFNYSFS